MVPSTSHHFGPFRLDPESRVLTRDDTVVPLAPRTLDLLAILVASQGRLLTKDELLRVVWGDVNVEEASLAFQVSTLRKALGEFGTVWIETVPKRRLFRTDLFSQETIALDGTEGAMLPFWSPDSRSVGFFAGGELKEIPVTGGPARSWVSTGTAFGGGATWGPGIILFAPSQHGLIHRIASPGGQPVPLALPQPGAYLFPQLLPDGRTFLVWERSRQVLYAASLDRPGALETVETNVTWGGGRCEAGHLVFRRGTTLVVRPFDPRRLAFSGPPRPLAENASMFSVSRTGTVVYRSEPPRLPQLTWFDRKGNRIGTVGDAGAIKGLSLAPSGRRAAIWRHAGGTIDIWTIDLPSGVTSKLTTDAALDTDAAWSPDGRTLAFSSNRGGNWAIYLKHLVDGKEELIADEPVLVVDTWTDDGKFVVARSMDHPGRLS